MCRILGRVKDGRMWNRFGIFKIFERGNEEYEEYAEG
jgi:hypothetical protein